MTENRSAGLVVYLLSKFLMGMMKIGWRMWETVRRLARWTRLSPTTTASRVSYVIVPLAPGFCPGSTPQLEVVFFFLSVSSHATMAKDIVLNGTLHNELLYLP